MVGLLDVNVLVALFDPRHVHHQAAHGWLGENKRQGWATCPITENGLVRIISNPGYPGRTTTLQDALLRLRQFRESGHHVFWPDSISVQEPQLFDFRHFRGHQQVSDIYLLGLAFQNQGRLVTFDRNIQVSAVRGAAAQNVARV